MPWYEWVAETVGKVTTAVRTGLRGVIELAEEIRPAIYPRPADVEAIEEIVEEMVATERFIQEVIPDEALRLARGVLTREPLRNVTRVRQWTALDPLEVAASDDYQITVRRVLVGPDGKMTHVDVAFPVGEAYTEDEMIRRAASALDQDFADAYTIGRSSLVRQYTVTQEVYLQTFVPL